MGKLRVTLFSAITALALIFFPKAAQATICTVPYVFTTGATIQAGPFNANFSTLQACGNSIDNSNIGANGIYASQLIPTTSTQATFGGGQPYTFSNGLSAGPITLTGAVGSPTAPYVATDGSNVIFNAVASSSPAEFSVNGTILSKIASTGQLLEAAQGASTLTYAAPMYTSSGGVVANTMHGTFGTTNCTLSSNACTAVVTLSGVTFASQTSYACYGSVGGSGGTTTTGISTTNSTGSVFDILVTNGSSGVISLGYVCLGT